MQLPPLNTETLPDCLQSQRYAVEYGYTLAQNRLAEKMVRAQQKLQSILKTSAKVSFPTLKEIFE